jgi:hypothetical protein
LYVPVSTLLLRDSADKGLEDASTESQNQLQQMASMNGGTVAANPACINAVPYAGKQTAPGQPQQ